MALLIKRKRGRPKRRFLDVVKEDMAKVGVNEMDIEDRTVWKKDDMLWLPLIEGKGRKKKNRTQKIEN